MTSLNTLSRLTAIKKHTAMSVSAAITDRSKSYFPVAGQATDGWSSEDEATATCFCGTVQLAFVSHLPRPPLVLLNVLLNPNPLNPLYRLPTDPASQPTIPA